MHPKMRRTKCVRTLMFDVRAVKICTKIIAKKKNTKQTAANSRTKQPNRNFTMFKNIKREWKKVICRFFFRFVWSVCARFWDECRRQIQLDSFRLQTVFIRFSFQILFRVCLLCFYCCCCCYCCFLSAVALCRIWCAAIILSLQWYITRVWQLIYNKLTIRAE